jgi:hypothetical protein
MTSEALFPRKPLKDVLQQKENKPAIDASAGRTQAWKGVTFGTRVQRTQTEIMSPVETHAMNVFKHIGYLLAA